MNNLYRFFEIESLSCYFEIYIGISSGHCEDFVVRQVVPGSVSVSASKLNTVTYPNLTAR